MTGRLAQQIEEATRRVASLECSFRVYREGYPAAAWRVGEQLDEAYLTLARLEALAEETRP